MSNINKIRLSGTTYDLEDLNAAKTVELTQAEYDALTVKDPNTFYIITDAEEADLSDYYTKSETSGATEISTALASKADTATTYTKTEVDNAITAATSTKQDTLVSGTNIKTVNNQSLLGSGNIEIQGGGAEYSAGDGIDITNDVISVTGKVDTSAFTAHTADTVIHVTSAEKAAWNTKSDFSGDYNDLTNKPTIPTVPTSNTAFTNDAGYITADAISGKVDTSTYNTYTAATDTALASKQTTLTAGTGISIVDNVISATGGGGGGATYSAGTNISIDTANTISCTLPIEKLSLTSSQDEAYKCLWIKPANVKIWINENRPTKAYLNYLKPAFSFGWNTIKALGFPAAFGQGNTLNGFNSFATGDNNNTKNNCEFATGAYNNSVNGSTNADKTLFSVGNGTANNARHNAFEIRQNGDIYCSDGTNDVKLQDTITATAANTTALGGLKLVKLTQAEYDALATKDSNTLYVIVN